MSSELERILKLAGQHMNAPVAEASGTCKHCGCEIDNPKPGCECEYDSHDASGDNWVAEEENPGTIKVNKDIPLAGDSIWFDNSIDAVHVTEITISDTDDSEEGDYRHVSVKHDGPWEIYTDSGFEDAISKIVGFEVEFTEQGMQEEGVASLEGYADVSEAVVGGNAKPADPNSVYARLMGDINTIQTGAMEGDDMADFIADELGDYLRNGDAPEGSPYEKAIGIIQDALHDGPAAQAEAAEQAGDFLSGAVAESEEVEEGRYDGPNSECCDAPLKNYNDGLGICSDCGDHAGPIDDEEELEEISEAPTMDTTQLIHLMKLAGLSEETIQSKLTEWANTPEGVNEIEPRVVGEPDNYNFAQAVNLSLKRYLDAEDMKVGLKEHKVEDIKAAYLAKKSK